jgi:hypothetical protein
MVLLETMLDSWGAACNTICAFGFSRFSFNINSVISGSRGGTGNPDTRIMIQMVPASVSGSFLNARGHHTPRFSVTYPDMSSWEFNGFRIVRFARP